MLVSAEVKQELSRFIWAKLWTGEGAETMIGGENAAKFAAENDKARFLYGAASLPLIAILDSEGNILDILPREDAAAFTISKELLLEALRKIR